MMDEHTSKFLCIFNDIEAFLRNITGTPKGTKFGDLISDACDTTKVLPKYAVVVREVADELRHLGELRNFFVHNHKYRHPLALPHRDALARIGTIRNCLRKPACVIPLFASDVMRCTPEESVGAVARKMLGKNFSQIPVRCGPVIVALLTTDTIARWLGESLAKNDGITEEAPVKDVWRCAEQNEKNYELLAPDDTVIDALGWFDSCSRSGRRLDAILITEDHEPNKPILGIITAFDIPKLHKEMRLPPEVKTVGGSKKPIT